MKQRPLEGIRVADLTMMWAGPYATKLLAEMGAEVIKVESPKAWDNIRTLLPQPGVADPWNSAFYFNEYNRDKKSLILDLADERGRDAFLKVVAKCDVVIENYRADVLDKLGLGYDVLRQIRPDIVLVSMAAFGKSGPDQDLVGFGPVIEMMSGLCSLTGYLDEDEPYKTGVSYGDPVGGTYAAASVALALARRQRTGKGAYIDLAQREGAAVLGGGAFVAASLRGETTPRHLGNRSDRWAPQGAYQCAGADQWIVVAVVTDEEWRAACAVLGRDDLAGLDLAERQARHDELDRVIADWARTRDPQDAMELLQEAGVPAGRILDTGEIHEDPQLNRRHFWSYMAHPKMHRYKQAGIAWRLVECNPALVRHSPLFGEHTREILSTLVGMTDAEIDGLYEAGVCADEPVNPGVG
jgi:crotonobetainyl-CoA:carnitine CoA-transferase CaiB-like acyl-CoA transferase